MRIVAAPRDENGVLTEDRARLEAWAPSTGWTYFEYADAFELLARISELQRSTSEDITVLEIVAHGNPARHVGRRGHSGRIASACVRNHGRNLTCLSGLQHRTRSSMVSAWRARDIRGRRTSRAKSLSERDGDDDMQIKIATSGFRSVNLTGRHGQDLVSAVEQVLRTPPASSARMRMAPDLTFVIPLPGGERVFELLAGGTVLHDPVTQKVCQFEGT